MRLEGGGQRRRSGGNEKYNYKLKGMEIQKKEDGPHQSTRYIPSTLGCGPGQARKARGKESHHKVVYQYYQ